jgi:hypothetical protein
MSEDYSPELKAAYAELEAAIEKVAALESQVQAGTPGLLIEWALVTASQYYKDGESIGYTNTQIIVPIKRDLPFYRLIGLLRYGLCQVEASAMTPDA